MKMGWKSSLMAAGVMLCALVAASRPSRGDGPVVEQGKFPNRVHVFEDFETVIEKRWWLRGVEEIKELAAPLGSLPNTRALRSRGGRDVEAGQDEKKVVLDSVMFNPVPGPPMGKNTRLSFRYRLAGSDKLRVQIFSLSKEDNYSIVLANLPQNQWQAATVDMTRLRRNDGAAGHLSEDERIDDIQFYVEPGARVIIDDIVLYDAAREDEKEPFPARIIFTGWFDTGEQGPVGRGRSGEGNEWPGEFRIVTHERPRTWKAAASVINERTKAHWLRIHMRGERPLAAKVRLRFLYKLMGADGKAVEVALVHQGSGKSRRAMVKGLVEGQWSAGAVDLNDASAEAQKSDPQLADEIHLLLPAGAQMLIDDLVLYEPAK